MRIKHHLSTPKIEELEQEAENEPKFQFPVGEIRNDDAYGGEGGEEGLDLDRDIRMQDLENLPFWLGGDDEEHQNMDDWGHEELEMRQLIGSETMCDDLIGADSFV